jgi:hypothetical protein
MQKRIKKIVYKDLIIQERYIFGNYLIMNIMIAWTCTKYSVINKICYILCIVLKNRI